LRTPEKPPPPALSFLSLLLSLYQLLGLFRLNIQLQVENGRQMKELVQLPDRAALAEEAANQEIGKSNGFVMKSKSEQYILRAYL
jgi:hypothetical protein